MNKGTLAFIHPKMSKTSIAAATAGVFLEYYDYMLYMHLLVILSPLFFPSANIALTTFLGFATFALATFIQPLGGILFGHLGDRIGRRKAMASSIALTTLSTFSIGLLPTYAQIGVAASILLILCRALQSLSIGGEVPGASSYLIENSTKENRCLRSSYIVTACTIPGILAAFLGYFFTRESFPEWGWRVPFLTTLIFGALGFYIRYRLQESYAFTKVVEKKEILKVPLLEVLKKDKIAILCTLGICATIEAPFSFLYVYLPHMINNSLQIPPHQIFAMNMLVMAFTAVCVVLMGKIGDKIGVRKMMIGGSIVFSVIIYPLFSLITVSQGIWTILMVEIIISFVWSIAAAPLNVVTGLMYPTQRRYSGNAFSWGLGSILFVGFSPLISQGLVLLTGSPTSPALFLSVCGIAGVIGVLYAPDISGEQDNPLQTLLKLKLSPQKQNS